MHLYAKTVRLQVTDADRSVARLDAALDDRQAEADPSGFPSPCGFGAKKRVTEAVDQGFGDSGPLVSDRKQHHRAPLTGVNSQRTGGSCMTDRISEHVRDSSQQVTAIRLNPECLGYLQLQM